MKNDQARVHTKLHPGVLYKKWSGLAPAPLYHIILLHARDSQLQYDIAGNLLHLHIIGNRWIFVIKVVLFLFPVVPDILHVVIIFHNVDELFHQLDLFLIL